LEESRVGKNKVNFKIERDSILAEFIWDTEKKWYIEIEIV
jgi:hypothetical protein